MSQGRVVSPVIQRFHPSEPLEDFTQFRQGHVPDGKRAAGLDVFLRLRCRTGLRVSSPFRGVRQATAHLENEECSNPT